MVGMGIKLILSLLIVLGTFISMASTSAVHAVEFIGQTNPAPLAVGEMNERNKSASSAQLAVSPGVNPDEIAERLLTSPFPESHLPVGFLDAEVSGGERRAIAGGIQISVGVGYPRSTAQSIFYAIYTIPSEAERAYGTHVNMLETDQGMIAYPINGNPYPDMTLLANPPISPTSGASAACLILMGSVYVGGTSVGAPSGDVAGTNACLLAEAGVKHLQTLGYASEPISSSTTAGTSPTDLVVRDPALATQTVTVGSTTISVFGEWEYDTASSMEQQATFTQIDMQNQVLKLVSYGVFQDETVEAPSDAIDVFSEAFFEGAGAATVEENASGELDDGTVWKMYTFDLSGTQVSFLVTASQNDDGAFVVTSLTANTSVFAETITEVQNDFVLNEKTRMFEGVNPLEIMRILPG